MGISNKDKPSFLKGHLTALELPVAVILCFIIGVIPLIMHLSQVPVGSDELDFTRSAETFIDIFSYYKSLIFVIAAWSLLGYRIICFFIGTSQVDYKGIIKSPYFYASAVFLVFAAISTVRSFYQYTVYHGISERYESFQVLIGYFIVFFTTISFTKNKFNAKIILYAISFSAFIIGLIGFFQFIKLDPFLTNFGGWLISGGIATFTPSFEKVYSTLLNPNCVGMYCAMTIPFLFCAGIFYKGNRLVNIFFFLTCALLFASFIGSASTGGLVAFVFVAVAAVLVIVINLYKNKNLAALKRLIFAFCLVFGICAVSAIVPAVRSNISDMARKIFSFNGSQNPYFYRDLSFSDGNATIEASTGKVTIDYNSEDKKVHLYDNDGTEAPVASSYQEDDGSTFYTHYVNGFGPIEISMESGMISFRHGTTYFFFVADNDGNILPLTKKGKVLLYEEQTPSFGFKGAEFFASSRGYIWSRSIPLLKYFVLTGSGPDTFSLVFPQNDILGKVKYMGDPYVIVDKAHNLYLQTFINTGGISLIALLVLFGFYLVTSFLSLVKYKYNDMFLFGMRFGAFLGICGYLVAAASTDSTIAISPVFWAILGLGIALNRINPSEERS